MCKNDSLKAHVLSYKKYMRKPSYLGVAIIIIARIQNTSQFHLLHIDISCMFYAIAPIQNALSCGCSLGMIYAGISDFKSLQPLGNSLYHTSGSYSWQQWYHNVGRRYIGMARMPASRNTFLKPANSEL